MGVLQMAYDKSEIRSRMKRFLDFKSVAVVGASDNPERIGGKPLALLRKIGFEGQVYGVNPKYAQVQGYSAVASVADLPNGIEFAILAVSPEAIVESLEILGKKGLQAATVFSSGFAESGAEGKALQGRMRQIAYRYGIAVNGPNCVGTISFINKRPATFASSISVLAPGKLGRVALVSQSGGFAPSIWADAMMAGAGFSHMFTTGNEAVLGFGDYLHLLADDPDTDVVLGYVEGIEDGEAFCSGAEALKRAGKPLILIKPGRSDEVIRVVASHTGQMAGNREAFQAAFAKHGVIEVHTFDTLIDHARVLDQRNAVEPISIATTSGGVGVYLTDACEIAGVKMAKLSGATQAELGRFIPSFGTTTNPVDVTAQVVNDTRSLSNVLGSLAADEQTGTLLFVLNGKAEKDKADEAIEIIAEAQRQSSKPLFVSWLGAPLEITRAATDAGIRLFSDPVRLIEPIANRMRWSKGASQHRPCPSSEKRVVREPSVTRAQLSLSPSGQFLLDEAQGLDLAERFGIDVPGRFVVTELASLDEHAGSIAFPCVMKLLKPALEHKSVAGGVIRGIKSRHELVAAWEKIQSIGGTAAIVEDQVPSDGSELLVGVLADATFGQRIVLGAGGVNTNQEADFVTLVGPVDEDYVHACFMQLRVARRLRDDGLPIEQIVSSITRTITSLSHLQYAEREVLAEVECNPLLISGDRLVAVDFLAIGKSE